MVFLIAIQVIWLLLPVAFGCSCGGPPNSNKLESLCLDYQASPDVFTARVINASCNCISSLNDSSYGQPTISCLSGRLSEYFTSEIVARATCGYPGYGILSCDRVLNKYKAIECPYEGQVFMDCASLCPTTCSSVDVPSPCPRVCVRGCECPEDMVFDEEQQKCVMESQCRNKNCPLVGQVTSLCTSSCPQDCFRPGNDSCPTLCNACACAPPAVADYITGKCVQPEQCTVCPIEGQVYKECGSYFPRTCDNVNDTNSWDTGCWQGCECPSGMVIDIEQRRCVDPSQCRREPPIIIRENGRCDNEFICPFNAQNSYYPCRYTVEVTEVFKGNNKVGQMITTNGPDLLTSCGNPQNILSVDTTYVVGIGGPCSAHSEWTRYSQYPAEERQALSNGCGLVEKNCSVTMIDGRIRHSRQRNRTVLRFSSDGDPDVTYICKLDDEEFIYCKSPIRWINLRKGKHVVTVTASCPTYEGKRPQAAKVFTIQVR